MEIPITIVLFVFVCLQLALFFSLTNGKSQRPNFILPENLPEISIIIAVRNEAANIINCLKSLELLDYPKEKLEIIIGNDQSTDQSATLINEFINGKPYYKLVNINSQLGNAKAKANVLAHLFKLCNHQIVFITDADIKVKSSWIKSIIPYFNNKNVGIVSGTTVVNGNGLFAKMQAIDWLYFSGLLAAFDLLGLKSTAVGNNMAINKNAYLATGGYENIKFSVTEDFALFKAITTIGFDSVNLLLAENLNESKPQSNIISFLHQRKRWLIGAQDLNLTWKLIFLLLAFFYPFLFILFFYSAKNAFTIWLIKLVLQLLITLNISLKLKQKINIVHLFLFEFYALFSTLIIPVFYLLPIKMNWKERKY